MTKVSRVWLWLFIFMLGFSAGIVMGVVVDVDTVYETTVKKLKQKNSPGGTIHVEVDSPVPEKSRGELRREKRDSRKEQRQIDREIRKSSRQK